MVNPNLSSYITKLRSMNVADDVIKEQLVKNGWQINEVQEALMPATLTNPTILPLLRFPDLVCGLASNMFCFYYFMDLVNIYGQYLELCN